jgi:hypothetical protein
MCIRGVVFGSRSSGDPVRQITESPRSGVQSLRRFKKLETQGSFQMFNGRQTGGELIGVRRELLTCLPGVATDRGTRS